MVLNDIPTRAALLSAIFFAAGQEIRNPKLEFRNKSKIQNLKRTLEPFGRFGFEILDLFRISDFEFRILRLWLRLRRSGLLDL